MAFILNLITAQVVAGVVSAFYPQYSSIILFNGGSLIQSEIAEGFSKDRFAELALGMSRQQVDQAIGLGFPIYPHLPREEHYLSNVWEYGERRSAFWLYQVRFTNDRVCKITMKFLWD